MTTLYRSPDERAAHAGAIASLAQEMRRPIDDVTRAYEVELARLKADARIPDFLTVFASRRTRSKLAGRS